jgi:hypothetical protein
MINCGYLTNKKDVAFIMQEQNQKRIAEKILSAITQYAALRNTTIRTSKDTIPPVGDVEKAAILKGGKAIVLLKNNDFIITNWKDAVAKNYMSADEADKQWKLINSGTLPLIIADGKEMPDQTPASVEIFYEIIGNQSPVASMNVLKEDEASKKYGTKGRNGVIEITTKNADAPASKPIFTKSEVEPRFPDTNGGWKSFLQKNLNGAVPSDNGAKAGTYNVAVQFIVDENGKLSDIKPLTKYGYGMEEEVVRLMKTSPDWIPAMQNGRNVTAYKKQTVTFVITEGK